MYERADYPEQFNSSASLYSISRQLSHPSTTSKIKRFIDILGGLAGLCLVALIFVPVTLAIRLDSPGPILYRQERCGLKGRRFYIYKFRSMVRGAEQLKSQIQNEAQGYIFKNRNDPRVTRVGRFLRKTSLDEFPQFWNVFVGDMSLVGTRPPTPDEVMNYSDRHHLRLNVKPGLTGEWQVYGRSDIKEFEEIVNLDLRYQTLWSPIYDLKLLWKTLFIVLKGTGSF